MSGPSRKTTLAAESDLFLIYCIYVVWLHKDKERPAREKTAILLHTHIHALILIGRRLI